MNKLKQLRLDAGLSQREMAELIGISSSTWNRYELGDVTKPSDIIVKKIADVLGISEVMVLGDIPQPKKNGGVTALQRLQQAKRNSVAAMSTPRKQTCVDDTEPNKTPMIPMTPMTPKQEQNVFESSNIRGLHQLGIVQVIRVTHTAANNYLMNGWILLDTRPAGDSDELFYCLLGSRRYVSSKEFEQIKRDRY